jgi:hypothetical protein
MTGVGFSTVTDSFSFEAIGFLVPLQVRENTQEMWGLYLLFYESVQGSKVIAGALSNLRHWGRGEASRVRRYP